jgi:hypothetical protein
MNGTRANRSLSGFYGAAISTLPSAKHYRGREAHLNFLVAELLAKAFYAESRARNERHIFGLDSPLSFLIFVYPHTTTHEIKPDLRLRFFTIFMSVNS